MIIPVEIGNPTSEAVAEAVFRSSADAVAAAVAAEREACARIADEHEQAGTNYDDNSGGVCARSIARAIRARSKGEIS